MSATFEFIEENDDYYTVDIDGEETYLAVGDFRRLEDFEYVDLAYAFSTWRSIKVSQVNSWGETVDVQVNRYSPADSFLGWLEDQVTEPDRVRDEVSICENCAEPTINDEMVTVKSGDTVCESCRDNDYMYVECCEDYVLSGDTTCTLADDYVCDSCLNYNYSHCEECDGYYRDEDSDEHQHDGVDDGCCEAPMQSFSIRHNVAVDGVFRDETLANDTRVKVTLPAGTISDEGIGQIANLLRNYGCNMEADIPYDGGGRYSTPEYEVAQKWVRASYSVPEIGPEWQTRQGNFTKRLSRMVYQKEGLKMPSTMLTEVGNIARNQSTAVDFWIETTRDLNQNASAFAHEESCWWQSYAYSRCLLKSNGGFGIRAYSSETANSDYPDGRVWVMPLKISDDAKLMPTFETANPDAFVVFNGYGSMSGYVPARMLSHMVGMTYRRIGFSCSPMYVNGESAYLIAPEEIASNYTDGSLRITTEVHSNLINTERVMTNA